MSDITLSQLETSEIYYKLPKLFLTRILKNYDEKHELKSFTVITSDYAEMSNDAKLAYGILYDRLQLSVKNAKEGNLNWVDKNGAVYLEYSIADLQVVLNCGNKKVIRLKKELAKKGLLREVQRGVHKTNLLYLQNIDVARKCQYDISSESQLNQLKCQKDISGSVPLTFQEVSKGHANKTDFNKDDDALNNKKFQKLWKFYQERFLAAGDFGAVQETDSSLQLENLFTQKGAALLNEAVNRLAAQDIPKGTIRKPMNYLISIFVKWDEMGIKTIDDAWIKDPFVDGYE